MTVGRICTGDQFVLQQTGYVQGTSLYDSRQNMYRGPVCITADRLCTGDQFV